MAGIHEVYKHYGQPHCGLVLPLYPSKEEDWSDRNLSVESPPNPQSLEMLQLRLKWLSPLQSSLSFTMSGFGYKLFGTTVSYCLAFSLYV